ncbi:hypothetical protein I7I53_06886 [Histoplasma capsulatum var. duboisii H88]|uniref:Uncharacterized protein n=1 Tax=Ajellomyces capsulatus (strain H88) TaxID=544711 RepID=A0A8A1LC84_AJEC8|nr:hypothetical protein I7I53_06886 [Histoplasma capsulatum var. duboisii H88]
MATNDVPAKGCLAQRWSRNLNPPNKPKYSGRICGLLASEKRVYHISPRLREKVANRFSTCVKK